MNPPKYTAIEYINFLIATQKAYSCSEAGRVQPEQPEPPAHDAITRLLHRLEPRPDELWEEARGLVKLKGGILVVDDSVLDRLYAKKMELVSWQWCGMHSRFPAGIVFRLGRESGKHGRVVKGINLTTLLWTDGDKRIPCDYRLYEKAVDGATKNDYFRAMLQTAQERGFVPSCVAFDSWVGALDNLKLIRSYGWIWLTRLKRNRLVNRDRTGKGHGC